jgi:hypothetical protein
MRMSKKTRTPCAVVVAALLLGTLCVFATTVSAASSSPVIINEIMSDNESAVLSDIGNYSDWIELYNNADYLVDISGMFLTDNLTTYMWQFPNGTVIEAHGYLLVWADASTRVGGLHTNFKLSASGESVGLFAIDGSLVDSVTFGKQVQDVSYGRTTDGGFTWGYLVNATPGEANSVEAALLYRYPWEIWGIIAAAVAIVCVVIFREKIHRGKTK